MCRYADVQMCGCENMGKCADVQVDVQICRCANVQILDYGVLKIFF
jgi:hypothetical protein